MTLDLRRRWITDLSTIGTLWINGEHCCFTLEDPVRPHKIPGGTAIPAGTYPVRLALSPKRKIIVPWIDDVPKYSNIQIHVGNYPKDTDGCILVGTDYAENMILHSKVAFERLMAKLKVANQITITIHNPVQTV